MSTTQNNKKTWTSHSMQGKRIKCHLCARRFSADCGLLMHIKAKHTPKTLRTLSLNHLKLFMKYTVKTKQRNLPKSLKVTGTTTTQNPEAGQIFGSTLVPSHRERQDIKAPIKGESKGQIKSSTTTESLHAPREEDIELGYSWSNATKNKNKTATKICDTKAMRYERNDRYFKKSLVNPMCVEQNRNTERQIIPGPSTASIHGFQGIAMTQITPECDAGIKREKDENNSSDNSVDHKIISGGDNIFAPMPNKMGNKGDSKTNRDEPSTGPILNNHCSVFPISNFKVGCNICNTYFKSDSVLLNHMKYCHVAHRCEWCGYMLSSRDLLTQHLALVHNIKQKNRYWRSNVTLNSKRGLRQSNKASYGKVQKTFPNVKYEPAAPAVFPNAQVEPSSSNVKVEPIFIKVEPNIDL